MGESAEGHDGAMAATANGNGEAAQERHKLAFNYRIEGDLTFISHQDTLRMFRRAVARAALRRTESRGAHTREDYPNSEDEWAGRNLIVSRSADGAIEVKDEPLSPMPSELAELLKD